MLRIFSRLFAILAICCAQIAFADDVKPIRIAALLGLTGEIAPLGNEVLRGVQIAIDEKSQTLPVSEMRRLLPKPLSHVSFQAIYKQLKTLEASGILSRFHNNYRINLGWAHAERIAMLNLVRRLEMQIEIPLSQESRFAKQQWRVSSLAHADDLWIELLVKCIHTFKPGVFYSWTPCLWFLLFHSEQERRFQKIMEDSGSKMQVLLGADSYLNNWLAKELPVRLYEIEHIRDEIFLADNINITLIGDLLITLRFSKDLYHEMETLFSTTKLTLENLPRRISRLLNTKGFVDISIELASKRADKIRRLFQEYF